MRVKYFKVRRALGTNHLAKNLIEYADYTYVTDTTWHLSTKKQLKPAITGRVIGAIVAIGFVAYYGDSGLAKWLTIAFMLTCTLLLVAATPRFSTERIITLHLWFGLVLELVAAFLVPNVWIIMCMAAASTITAGVSSSNTKANRFTGIIGALAMGAIGSFHDISEWRTYTIILIVIALVASATSRMLRALTKFEKNAFEEIAASADAIVWISEINSLKIRTVAGATQALTGLNPKEWASLNHLSIVHPEDKVGFRQLSSEHSSTGVWEGRIRHNATWRWVRETYTKHTNSDGVEILRGITVDINELAKTNEKLTKASELATRRANFDTLTNLPNRSFLINSVKEKQTKSFMLISIEINQFQQINEALGYKAGDRSIIVIAQRLKNIVKNIPAEVGRVDGSEFAILWQTQADELEIESFVELIISRCAAPIEIDSAPVQLDVSVSVAISKPDDDVDIVLRRARAALAHAKVTGARWRIADEEDFNQRAERFELARQVERAIKDEQFELWFQPKNNLFDDQIIGFEGLVRWRHPSHTKILPPWRFLNILEISQHADEFDRFVIQKAIEFSSYCYHNGYSSTISVNVPGRALHQKDLVSFIKNLLAVWDTPASTLVLELTEDAFDGDIAKIKPTMQELADLGCGISIDDFGTGHSSLTRLRTLPVTEIKIDRSFVMDMQPEDEIIVTSIIQLARMMELNCVAEGVETFELKQKLIELGCIQAQGFYYSEPVPKENALDLISEQHATAN